ncbi:MAG: hypothetical protein KC646_03830 [Candidatus Cloacimonetes bacterium]|nr:hypothetical protein [Candidatus Cloacimonadota bacterium]
MFKKLLLGSLLTIFTSSSFCAPFYFQSNSSAANGKSAIYLASKTMDLSKDPEVVEAILSGEVILFDGGHTSYTLTLPYQTKKGSFTTEFTLRRHGALFALSHSDDSDRTYFPANLSNTTPFKLTHKKKDRFSLNIAFEIADNQEEKDLLSTLKLSKDGLLSKNKYKFKIGLLSMIKEANFEKKDNFDNLHDQ